MLHMDDLPWTVVQPLQVPDPFHVEIGEGPVLVFDQTHVVEDDRQFIHTRHFVIGLAFVNALRTARPD